MNTPLELISVIVPIFKVEQYLDHCLQSIVEQSFKNLEIILVDDGSPDNCPAICDAWANKDARIRVVHKKNGGLSSARNAGLAAATGKYIAFVDSDDYIASDFIQLMYERIVTDDSDIAICSVFQVDSNNDIQTWRSLTNEVLTREEALRRIVPDLENDTIFVVVWNKLYKRKTLSSITFPEGRLHEDEFVCHHIINNANSVSCLEMPLYYYQIREGSITQTATKKRVQDTFAAYEDRANFYTSIGFYDEAVRTFKVLCELLLINDNLEMELRRTKAKQYLKLYRRICKDSVFSYKTDRFYLFAYPCNSICGLLFRSCYTFYHKFRGFMI